MIDTMIGVAVAGIAFILILSGFDHKELLVQQEIAYTCSNVNKVELNGEWYTCEKVKK